MEVMSDFLSQRRSSGTEEERPERTTITTATPTMINICRSTSIINNNSNNNDSRDDDNNSEDLSQSGRADEQMEDLVDTECRGGGGATERRNRAMLAEDEPDEHSTSSNATIIETRRITSNNNNNNWPTTNTTMTDEAGNRWNGTATTDDTAAIGGGGDTTVIRRRPAQQKPQLPPKPQLDIVRYSMANAKDDLDLDTILSELLELESQLSGESDGSNQWMLGLPTLLAAGSNTSNATNRTTPVPKVAATPSTSNEASRECVDAVTNNNCYNNNNNNGGYTIDAEEIVQMSRYTVPITPSSASHTSASELELRAESWTPRKQQQQLIHANNNNIIESSSCASPDADSAFGDASSTSSGGGASTSNSSSSVTTAAAGRTVAAATTAAEAPGMSRQYVDVNGVTLSNASSTLLSSSGRGDELATTRRRIAPSAQPVSNYRNGGVMDECIVWSAERQSHRYSPGPPLPTSLSNASVASSSTVFSAPKSASLAATAHSPSASSSSASTSSRLLSAAGDEKARKIREALQKMKEAKRKRIYVKIFLDGGTATKGLLIDERWTVAETMRQLTLKLNEDPERTATTSLSVDHAIVEEYPDLLISRIYEDHEYVVENIEDWLADSKNKLHFVRVSQKYDFLRRPHDYLLRSTDADESADSSGADANVSSSSNQQQQQSRSPSPRARRALINRFLNDGSAGCGETAVNEGGGATPPVLPLEGWLMLKADGRKTWRRHYFVLRSSGLYYMPKSGRQWRGGAASQLECLMSVYNNQIYVGASADWRKKYRAPTEHGFAIKHPKIQVKTSKYIKYICADSDATLQRWVTALRITRNGFRTLYDNYNAALAVTAAADASLSSSRQRVPPPPPRVGDATLLTLRLAARPPGTLSPSDGQPSLFEQDECGTIKRQPFILLPSTYDVNTACAADDGGGRRLDDDDRVVLEEDDFCGSGGGAGDDVDSDEDEQFPPPPPIYLSTVAESNTPQRRAVPPPPPPRPLIGGGPTRLEAAKPPPPPRRAETTAVVCAVASPSDNNRSPVKWEAQPSQQQRINNNGEDNNNHYFKQQQQPLMNELCAQLRRVAANRAEGHQPTAAPFSR